MERDEAIRIALLASSGEATPQQREELDRLLERDPALRAELASYSALSSAWKHAAQATPPAHLRAAVLAGAAKQRSCKRIIHILMPVVSIAATLFFAVTLVMLNHPDTTLTHGTPQAIPDAVVSQPLAAVTPAVADADGDIFGSDNADMNALDSAITLLATERSLNQSLVADASETHAVPASITRTLDSIGEWLSTSSLGDTTL